MKDAECQENLDTNFGSGRKAFRQNISYSHAADGPTGT